MTRADTFFCINNFEFFTDGWKNQRDIETFCLFCFLFSHTSFRIYSRNCFKWCLCSFLICINKVLKKIELKKVLLKYSNTKCWRSRQCHKLCYFHSLSLIFSSGIIFVALVVFVHLHYSMLSSNSGTLKFDYVLFDEVFILLFR